MELHTHKLIETFTLSNKAQKLKLLDDIGRQQDPTILQFLINTLGDEAWPVRKAAADRILVYRDGAIQPLSNALGSFSEDIQYWSLRILSQLGASATPAILRAMKNPNPDVRHFAAISIGELKEGQGVPYLLKSLGDEKWLVRKAASDALAKFGDAVVPAIEQVMKATKDENVRFWAIKTFGKLGAAAQKILLDALRAGNRELRYVIAASLGESGDTRVIKVLIDSLADPDWTIRKSAMAALAEIGDNAIDPMIQALQEPNDEIRDGCLRALVRVGDRAVVRMFEHLAKSDDNMRYLVRKAMVKMGSKVTDPLVRLFKSSDPQIAAFSAATLGEIGSPKAVPVLLEGLSHDDWNVRRSCAYALADIGEKGVEQIAEALVHTNEDVRYWVTRILEQIGEPGMPFLMKALSDKNKSIRYFAAKALGNSRNPDVVRALIAALADVSWSVRKVASESIIRLERLAVDQLLKNMSNDNEDIRYWVGKILQQGGSGHLDRIMEAMRIGDPEVRLYASQALGAIADPRSTDALIFALRDGNEWVRIYAAIALGKIGDPRAITPLIHSLADRSDEIHRNVMLAFKKLGPDKVRAELARAAEGDDPILRRNAAVAIGELRDERSVDLLVVMMGDDNERVRMAAAEALGNFSSVKALTCLHEGLTDSAAPVKSRVVAAIAKLAQPQSVLALLALLAKSTNERETQMFKRNLVQMAGRNPSAFVVIFAHESPVYRMSAAESLVGLGLPILPFLEEAAANKAANELMKYWCNKTIKKIRNPEEPLRETQTP